MVQSFNREDHKVLLGFGREIQAVLAQQKQKTTPPKCPLITLGTDWGKHTICDYKPAQAAKLFSAGSATYSGEKNITVPPGLRLHTSQLPPKFHSDKTPSCSFISIGIATDYTFDVDLHSKYDCVGLALDPTVEYPRTLSPGVTFLKAGAHSSTEKELAYDSILWSVPSLLHTWGAPYLNVLKMDCEGCEYQLGFNVLHDDPHFFNRVLQINIEIHLPRKYLKSEVEMRGLATLYKQLTAAGLQLVHMDDGKCSGEDQKTGCHPKLELAGIPCATGCRSYLFARVLNP